MNNELIAGRAFQKYERKTPAKKSRSKAEKLPEKMDKQEGEKDSHDINIIKELENFSSQIGKHSTAKKEITEEG